MEENIVIIDAIFGSGLTRPIEGFVSQLINYINQQKGIKVAVDIPSGLNGEEVEPILNNNAIIKANFTLTFQFPFLSFFFAESNSYVGEWYVLPIELHQSSIDEMQTPYHLVMSDDIRFNDRNRFDHKGTYGHALIVAGSFGMAGAALMTAKACLKTGCGLVTTHIPKAIYSIIQTAFPETIVSIDNNDKFISGLPDLKSYKAIGVGPGIGISVTVQNFIEQLFDSVKCPIVIDADALNLLAGHQELLHKLPANSILTPHPGEFARLVGKPENSFDGLQKVQAFAKKTNCIIVLKGAYTKIALPNGSVFINQTGNNGMATGGSGDVLTGIITSLLAQGYAPEKAAITGVYLHGLAGDLALENESPESVLASDIINNIGNAINKTRENKVIRK